MAAAAPEKQFTGRHMLIITLSFFAVVVGVNLAMAYFANSTWSGLVVANGYVASQSFGKDLEKARAQEALGWAVDLRHEQGRLAVTFTDRANGRLSALSVTGTLRRPTTDKLDQQLTFAAAGPGSYATDAKLQPGIWEVEIDAADAAGETYHKTFRFLVKG